MQTDPPCDSGLSDQNGLDEIFGPMPMLPAPSTRRWTIRRKVAVIEAVRGGWVPIEEVCRIYAISVDEFIAWERDIDQFGVYGLRVTRYQIYRHRNQRSRRRVSGA
jgi:Protein of unknown function (DUF1153)